MWDQYKKSLFGMQAVIALDTAAAYLQIYRAWQPTVMFFAILQIASVAGALWAIRIRKRFPSNV
jgi:hypothetical protein